MGITIHYRLQLAAASPRQVRELLARLHQRALTLPLARVGNVLELRGTAACDYQRYDRQDPHRCLLSQASQRVEPPGSHDQSRICRVPPRHLMAFTTWPGEGCETASFGLGRYPLTLRISHSGQRGRSHRVRTGLTGWQWSASGKTLSAASPEYGGTEHFLRCHLSVMALLECAQALGIKCDVRDEADFWQQRDVETLARRVGRWDAAIAKRASQLRDRLGAGLVAEIDRLATTGQPPAQPSGGT